MLGPYDGETRAVLAAPAARSTTYTGSAVDIRDAIGPLAIYVVAGPGTGGGSCALKIQHSTTLAGGGSWGEITGGALCTHEATARIRASRFDTRALRGYIRVVGTVSGTHSATYGVFCSYTKQHRA